MIFIRSLQVFLYSLVLNLSKKIPIMFNSLLPESETARAQFYIIMGFVVNYLNFIPLIGTLLLVFGTIKIWETTLDRQAKLMWSVPLMLHGVPWIWFIFI